LHDIAILKVEIANWEIFPLSVGKLTENQIGDTVWTLGHPMGIGWLLAKGILSGVKYDSDGYAYLFSDVATAPGSSGSPILNIKGQIIGMVQQGMPGIGCIGIAADRFIVMITAAIQADRDLEKTRYELEKLQERARREWRRIIEKKDEWGLGAYETLAPDSEEAVRAYRVLRATVADAGIPDSAEKQVVNGINIRLHGKTPRGRYTAVIYFDLKGSSMLTSYSETEQLFKTISGEETGRGHGNRRKND
jgi:hypothetical protein